jgi:hypothetical protein
MKNTRIMKANLFEGALINKTEEERYEIAKNLYNHSVRTIKNAIEEAGEAFDGELIVYLRTDMIVPYDIQRMLDENRIKKIVLEYNPNLRKLPVIYYNPTKECPLLIIEGQHTVYSTDAWLRIKGEEMPMIKCLVKTNITEEEADEIFLYQNNNVKKVSMVERIAAEIKRNPQGKTSIFVNLVEQKGFYLQGLYEAIHHKKNPCRTANKLGSIKKSKELFDYNNEAFEWLLDIIKEAGYSKKQGALNGEFLTALFNFYNKQTSIFMKNKLVEIFKEAKTPKAFYGKEDTRGNSCVIANEILKKLKS